MIKQLDLFELFFFVFLLKCFMGIFFWCFFFYKMTKNKNLLHCLFYTTNLFHWCFFTTFFCSSFIFLYPKNQATTERKKPKTKAKKNYKFFSHLSFYGVAPRHILNGRDQKGLQSMNKQPTWFFSGNCIIFFFHCGLIKHCLRSPWKMRVIKVCRFQLKCLCNNI